MEKRVLEWLGTKIPKESIAIHSFNQICKGTFPQRW